MYERSRNILDCNIAGFNYYDGLDVLKKLKLGAPVTLKPEHDNPYDPNAVSIYYKNIKLGYVPRAKNTYISDLLYFGYGDIFEARVNARNMDAHPEHQFRIVVKVKDNRRF